MKELSTHVENRPLKCLRYKQNTDSFKYVPIMYAMVYITEIYITREYINHTYRHDLKS